ncbi:MAG: DUF1800 domain-containing protein [Bacteroidetes bacterium]|nr:DUF1800 domain-containing protein [Bacteroidota bacterium]
MHAAVEGATRVDTTMRSAATASADAQSGMNAAPRPDSPPRQGRRKLPPMLFGTERRTQAGLEPYVPSAAEPWDALRAGHLLRRAAFLPTQAELTAALGMEPGALVDALLDVAGEPQPPGSWIAEISPEPTTGEEEAAYDSQNKNWMNDLRAWWAGLMTASGMSIVEKMTLFWHGHITGEGGIVKVPQYMYQQNALFRSHALGNFRDLMKAVNHDPAMLRYLDGEINIGSNPNENYGRELMELFTMGEGRYTEQDIKEAARCLTGWQLDEFTSFDATFSPLFHDTGNKTFMGRTIVGRSSLDGRFEGDEVVDVIFEDESVAKFICRKLYLAFVYNNPAAVDGDVVNAMAAVFRDNDYEIKPVLEVLLKSAHFFDEVNIGAMIKSPAVLEIGMARQLAADPGGARLVADMRVLEQHLLDPPNVAGWEGYRSWISTTTYPFRKSYAERFVTGLQPGGSGQTPMNVVAWGKQFPDYYDADKLIDHILTLLLPKKVSDTRRASYLQTMLGGAPVYEWNIEVPNADTNLRNMLVRIISAPDFQLH